MICKGILAQAHCIRSNLQDTPLSDMEETWFTDESKHMQDGHRYAGVAVTMTFKVIWVEVVLPPTSAQRAKLIALTKALNLGKNKKINIYTDSR